MPNPVRSVEKPLSSRLTAKVRDGSIMLHEYSFHAGVQKKLAMVVSADEFNTLCRLVQRYRQLKGEFCASDLKEVM